MVSLQSNKTLRQSVSKQQTTRAILSTQDWEGVFQASLTHLLSMLSRTIKACTVHSDCLRGSSTLSGPHPPVEVPPFLGYLCACLMTYHAFPSA